MGSISPSNGGSVSSSSSAASGPARGTSGTGDKTFNFGNPNAKQSIGTVITNPIVLIAGVAVLWILLAKRRR